MLPFMPRGRNLRHVVGIELSETRFAAAVAVLGQLAAANPRRYRFHCHEPSAAAAAASAAAVAAAPADGFAPSAAPLAEAGLTERDSSGHDRTLVFRHGNL